MSDNFQEMLQARTLTEQSKKNYLNQYNKIMKSEMFGKNLVSNSQENIIKYLKMMYDKPSSLYTMLNIPVLILKFNDLPIDEIIKEKERLRKKDGINRDEELSLLDKTLPSYEELKNHVNSLRILATTRAGIINYIINYLLVNLGLRNKDVDIFITDDKKRVLTTENTLLVLKTKCILYVNDYKTLKTYGAKKFDIIDKTFLKTITENLELINNNYLLLNKNGEHMENAGLSAAILRRTYKGIGEGSIFKILIKRASTEESSINKLRQLSQQRGTDINTILEYYHLEKSK